MASWLHSKQNDLTCISTYYSKLAEDVGQGNGKSIFRQLREKGSQQHGGCWQRDMTVGLTVRIVFVPKLFCFAQWWATVETSLARGRS